MQFPTSWRKYGHHQKTFASEYWHDDAAEWSETPLCKACHETYILMQKLSKATGANRG